MVDACLDPYYSFQRLYFLWKSEQRHGTRLTAIILSTEMPGLDKKITQFIGSSTSQLDDLSGPEVAVYVSSSDERDGTDPKEKDEYMRNKYREIAYSIGRLLKVPPEKFPCIVFFDNLIRPKEIVVIELLPILGSNAKTHEIGRFFLSLFTITQNIVSLPEDERLESLRKAIIKKWGKKKDLENSIQTIKSSLSFVEIAAKTVETITNIVDALLSMKRP
jgi:hypothetical protein